MKPKYKIEPLDNDKHDREAFSCGVVALDHYLRQRASEEVSMKIAAAHVLYEVGSSLVIGYYTLSMSSILFKDLPREITRKIPRYPSLPATLIGRFAVDASFQGRGIGRRLLVDALRRSLRLSRDAGAMAVLVDTREASARRFYEGFSFRSLPNRESSLFLPMIEVEDLFPPL